MRVLVLGGRGHLGQKVVAALARLPDLEVAAGSRGGQIQVDLRRPETLCALDDFQVVVNCSDTLRAPPDEALSRTVARGGWFIEAGASAATIARLLASPVSGPGAAVVGAGLFPGMSNLLARRCFDAGGGPAVSLGVLISPFSGAGAGIASLMADALLSPVERWDRGERVTLPALAPGPILPFGRRRRRTYAASLPEVAMLRASTGASSVSAWLAANPPILAPVLGALAWLARGPRWWRKLARGFARLSMQLVRGTLFRRRRCHVELTAVAGDHAATLAFPDALGATAAALAAAVATLRDQPPTPGIHLPDQLFDLDDQLSRMRDLSYPPAAWQQVTGKSAAAPSTDRREADRSARRRAGPRAVR